MNRNTLKLNFVSCVCPRLVKMERHRIWERGESAKSKSFSYNYRDFVLEIPYEWKNREYVIENLSVMFTDWNGKADLLIVTPKTYTCGGFTKYNDWGHSFTHKIGFFAKLNEKLDIGDFCETLEGARERGFRAELLIAHIRALEAKKAVELSLRRLELERVLEPILGKQGQKVKIADLPTRETIGACELGFRNALKLAGWNGKSKYITIDYFALALVDANSIYKKYFYQFQQVLKSKFGMEIA